MDVDLKRNCLLMIYIDINIDTDTETDIDVDPGIDCWIQFANFF